MLVGFQVPVESMEDDVVQLRSHSVDGEWKIVKMPLPLTALLELTEPLPSSNSQALPPDCRSTTTRLKFSPVVVGGGGVAGLTVSVTGSVTGLFDTAEEVNVTLPV